MHICSFSGPSLCPSSGSLVAQICVQGFFLYLQGWRLQQSAPVYEYPPNIYIYIYICINDHRYTWDFLCFSLWPLPLPLWLGTTGKSLPLMVFHHQAIIHRDIIPLSLLSSRLSGPSSLKPLFVWQVLQKVLPLTHCSKFMHPLVLASLALVLIF